MSTNEIPRLARCTLLALTISVSTVAQDPPNDEATIRQTAARAKVGTTLRDKWHLNELIAVGGMGAVYDGTHRNGMRGAVKVLDPCLSQSVEARQRFLREGRLANRVHHVGAVQVLDDDETEDGTAYLVMELLEGSTLESLAERSGGKLEAATAIELGLQVVDTLAEAHSSGIVHRDIKPENLFLTTDGVVKVVDFGIAGMLAREGSVMLTLSGAPIGTPAFMSPEQARGRWELVDHQSDLYSLGATLFTLLTGKLVHDKAGTVAEMLVLAITVNPPSLADIMPEAPAALVNAIDGALKLEKSERWANAATMRSALEEGYLALTGNQAPASRGRSPSSPPVAAASVTERARLMLQTTLSLKRPPKLRWVVSGAIVAVAAAATFLAVIVPRGSAVAATEHATTPMLVAAITAPSAEPPPPALSLPSVAPQPTARPRISVSATAPSPTARRYDPLYDRRH
jgi:eukaryotic-like serine/threonine-protein kinase